MFKSKTVDDKSADPDYVAELKYNGWRLLLTSDADGNAFGYNSKGSKMSYLKLDGVKLPPNSQFTCEWMDRRTINIKNQLIVFNVMRYKGMICDFSYTRRRELIEQLFPEQTQGELLIKPSQVFETNFREVWHQYRNIKEIEGLVIKRKSAPLEYGYNGLRKSPIEIKVKK